MTAMDNVFHMLDGKGIPPGYNGPLITAINQTGPEGKGQTDYFKFALYAGNGNMHLEFRRIDLVDQLNSVAGGGALRKPKPEQQQPETSNKSETQNELIAA